MNFAIKQSIRIFIAGTVILIIAIAVFYKLNYNNILNYQLNESKLIANEISKHIDKYIIEDVKKAKGIVVAPVIQNALSTSNEHFQSLSKKERDEEILQNNNKWKSIKDHNNSFILDYTNNSIAKYLKTLQSNAENEYGEIFLTNKYGALIASTAKLTTYAHGHKYWWQGSYNDGKGAVFLDDRGYDTSVDGYVLGVVIPIKKDNEIIGILKANFNIIGSTSTIIHNSQVRNHEKLKLIRSCGLIVFEEGLEPLSKRISDKLLKKIKHKSNEAFLFEDNGEKYVVGLSQISISSGMKNYKFGGNFESVDHKKGNSGESWIIIDFKPFSNIITQTKSIVSSLWIIGFLLLLAIAIISLLIGKRTAKPLKELLTQIERISKGDYGLEIITHRKDEIGELANSFNQMIAYLKESTTSITKLNNANQQLAISEDKYRSLVETIDEGIGNVDENEKFIFVNQTAADIFGYSKDEMLGKNLKELTSPEMFNKILDKTASRRKGNSSSYELQILRKNGEQKIIRIMTTPIFTKNGIHKGSFGVFHDITEHKYYEQQLIENTLALKKSENTYRLFTENTLDTIWSTDQHYNMTFVNKAIFQFLGYTPEEVLAMHLKQYTTAESFDKISRATEKLLSKFELGKMGQELIEIQQIKKDNSVIDKIETELLKMDKLKSIGTLAGGIAHDFNNVLTGIYGNVSLALMKLSENHPSYRFLTNAEKSINRASKLTSQLLTFSKGGSPIKKNINLTRIIKETALFDLSGSNLKPVFNFAQNVFTVKVDEGQMQQVFSNLTINAKQASPNSGHLYFSVNNCLVDDNEILDLKPGQYLKITVQDEGVGIAQKYIDKIFDPYFTTKQTGSGLGLATTYSIIKKHKGYLGIDSELGKGTKFTIYLPASKVKEIMKEEKAEIIVNKTHTLKVLIMDDEEVICEMLTEMIEMLGYEVDFVLDGEHAIDKYQDAIKNDEPFNIVIMDLTIPGGMGGKEAVKKILEINENAKVIVSSGYTSNSALAEYKSFGFIDIIGKPYTMPKLKETLNRVLDDDFS